jgi:hypothetical protein
MDNHILATILPAQPSAAVLAFAGVDADQFPPEGWEQIAKIAKAIETMTAGDDMRATVRKIEWLASLVPQHCSSRNAMRDTLVALGYLTLAAMWDGEVSTGKATIEFVGGRLYLQGPRNKGGREALKKVSGRMFHPATGSDQAKWSVPASSALAFRRVIMTHWPMAEGLSACVAEAMAVPVAVVAVAELPPAPAKTATVTFTPCTGGWEIRSPYSAKFVAQLKSEIPYKDRQWNGIAKAWIVTPAWVDTAREIAESVYGCEAIAA